MKCFKCNNEIKDKVYSYAGLHQCEKCNDKSNGTISLDNILDKIIKDQNKNNDRKEL